jgi:uncharacterized protein YggT (Ycf19 family)
MIVLDFLTFSYEFLMYLYSRYIETLPFVHNFSLFLIDLGFYHYLDKFIVLFSKIIDFIILSIPTIFLKNIQTALKVFRFMFSLRITAGWFPTFNPHRGPLAIITEPVDFVMRPFYSRMPKLPYIDLTSWCLNFILDALIDFLEFFIRMSITYYVEENI